MYILHIIERQDKWENIGVYSSYDNAFEELRKYVARALNEFDHNVDDIMIKNYFKRMGNLREVSYTINEYTVDGPMKGDVL